MVAIDKKLWLFGLFVIGTFAASTFLSAKIMANDHLDTAKVFIMEHYWTGVTLYIIGSIAITTLAIPFAMLDLLDMYIFKFPVNILLMFLVKAIGAALVYLITNSLIDKEKTRAEYIKVPLIQKVNSVIKDSPIYYGTLIR